MKPFFPRLILLGTPLVLAAQSTLSWAAPVDSTGATSQTAVLPWLTGNLPANSPVGDEFSRAVTILEKCRAAEKEATRRAARGEITSQQLQALHSATEQAQKRVDALLTNSKPRLIPAFLVSVPPAREASIGSPNRKLAPISKNAALTPRLTILDHANEGSMASAIFGNRQMLHRPQKAGTLPKISFIAMLPQDSAAGRDTTSLRTNSGTPISSELVPANSATKTAVVIAPTPAPSRPASPLGSPVATVPAITIAPPKTAAPKATENAAAQKSPTQSAADLQRLAQLDAALQRADKNLSAANAALSEGQQQLTRFASTLRQAMLDAGPDAVGLHPFVKVAEKYAGTPYVWGGESRTGFDCSGMIIRVMRDLGYKALPHSAAEQFHYGKPIAQPLLKPGDLVFFANTYKAGISHVGIYLGKRRFIHAAGTGKGTIVSSLDTPKFQEKYAGARRLITARGD